uniref:type II secretion system F family protein n=1 Tax=Orrella sp. TaxID=1921583 RepID=UPI0040481E27
MDSDEMQRAHLLILVLSGLTVMGLSLGVMTLQIPLGRWRHQLERLLSWTQRERYQRQLRHAGLDHWVVADLLMLRIILSGVGFLLSLCLLGSVLIAAMTAFVAWLAVWLWLRSRALQYQQQLTAQLPAFLDLLCLCLGSGMNLQTAVALVLDLYGQGTVGRTQIGAHRGLLMHWRRWLSAVSSGSGRVKAFEQLMHDVSAPSVRRVCVVMIQAERAGAGMANPLMRQAEQLRQDRLMSIERKAMQAPVKMLMPLVICFFPSTFLVLGFSMWVNLADTLQGMG